MEHQQQLRDMIQNQIIKRGLENPTVLNALERFPRHLFVPPSAEQDAYKDEPIILPEEFATISQPYMVAYMTDALQCRSSDKVLEIGTGSGYQTSILSYLCSEVYTLERHYTLSENAKRTLQHLGCYNVQFKVGERLDEWVEAGPFDKILVTAASHDVPDILHKQLAEDGMMLIPLGDATVQTLILVQKRHGQLEYTSLIPCVFVPLIVDHHPLTGDGDTLSNETE